MNAIISDATPVGMEGFAPVLNVAYPDMGIGTLVRLRGERRPNLCNQRRISLRRNFSQEVQERTAEHQTSDINRVF